MYILGINTAYHETAAALLRDEIVVAAVEEERFSGIRHDKQASPFGSWQLPFQAINYCLKETNINLGEIDHIAFSFKPRLLWGSMWLSLIQGKWQQFQRQAGYWYFNCNLQNSLFAEVPRQKEILKRFLVNELKRVHFVDHHLAHAASAFFCSSFDEAGILSVDGIGERTCTLLGIGRENKIIPLRDFSYPHSLGFFYEEITKFLGFQRNHDEYKVMALASYGNPKYYDQLRRLIPLEKDGSYKVKIDFRKSSIFGAKELIEVLPVSPRMWGAKIEQEHLDIAASGQKVLEETLLHLTKWLHRKTQPNLCIAGGIGLNCVANERLRVDSPFQNIFIQPAANDAGTALGAALWVYHQKLDRPRGYIMEHVYLGPEFSDKEIEQKLKERKVQYRRENDIAKTAAILIAQGNIIGWFQGKME